MASGNGSCLTSCLLLVTIVGAVLMARYIAPVRVPGPMAHPIKYKIVTGAFALVLDLVHLTRLKSSVSPM